jgi:hypothetical protein
MSQTVYIVERVSIYRHGVLGVFTTLDEAKQCAEAAVTAPKPAGEWYFDGDGHHKFVVMAYPVGEQSDGTVCGVLRGHKQNGVTLDGGKRYGLYTWEDHA